MTLHFEISQIFFPAVFLKVGGVFVDHACRQKCQCSEGSQIECSDLQCDKFAKCGVQGGIRACYCKDGYVGDGLECEQGSPNFLETFLIAI